MKKITFIIISLILFVSSFSRADEGMWIPMLLEKYNYADMKANGLKLTPEEIYSINNASLKDAIVIFGRGCTGELISDEGLLITNHHCGYGQIQKHSSVEHDYLTDGFWAMNRKEELINPGLTVTFLVRMEDVTGKILVGVAENMEAEERSKIIKENIKKLEKEVVEGTHYEAVVKPFYNGNEFYLFVNEIYKDVRLVGAPPSAIGKFGGDTDNWMWPRHTGDFSLFRIYADKDNNPAEYSEDNVPYKPKKHFPVSLKGVKKGDFTMVYGYPYTTTEYLPSFAVENKLNIHNPHRIAIRESILDNMRADMEASPKVRIQYSSKYAGVANAWKKWIGESKGLKRLDAVVKKKNFEADLMQWVNADSKRKEKYGHILAEYRRIYKEIIPYQQAVDYFYEAVYRNDILKWASSFRSLERAAASDEAWAAEIEKFDKRAANFFKDYNLPTDKKVFANVSLKLYYENVEKEFIPEFYNEIQKKYKGDFLAYAEKIYSKSFITSPESVAKALHGSKPSKLKKIMKDPFIQIWSDYLAEYFEANAKVNAYNRELAELDRIYMKAIMEYREGELIYPDANATLRITYGKVDDYKPMDAVNYKHFTTLDGIIEKDDPEIYDYDVPDKLKELYQTKDYGQYGVNGTMPVCFTASNHTTGGNSGSPVINGNGELIGVNFDRNWEGTMSDVMYDPEMCRNITLDIRYALFIIDKFAGATHLVNEMTIVK